MKSYTEQKWAWPWAREALKNLGFSYNIFAMAEASDFKIGMRLGFPRPIIKSQPEKSGRKEAPK